MDMQTRHKYKFIVNPEMVKWKVGQEKDTVNEASTWIEKDDKRSATLSTGDKIEDIIDMVFASTADANKMANPKSTKNKIDKAQTGNKISKILNISSENNIIGYNTANNEYQRQFIYYINPSSII